MAIPSLPAQGSPNWYTYATGLDSAVRGAAQVADLTAAGTTTGDALRAAYVPQIKGAPGKVGAGSTGAPVVAGPTQAGVAPGSAFLSQFISWSTATQNAEIAKMKAAGITWARIDVDLGNVYNSGGAYSWTQTDARILPFLNNGIQVVALLLNPPPFPQPSTPDPAVLGPMAGAVAARYAPQGVHVYELLNEPNLTNILAAASGNARAALYTTLLQSMTTAIRASDSQAFIIMGSLAPPAVANGADGGGSGGTALSPLSFLTQVYANGGGGYFDAVGMHPYSFPNPSPMAGDVNYWNQFFHLDQIRAVMVANGDSAKGVWITEFGLPYSVDPTAYNSLSSIIDPASQIRSFQDAFAQYQKWPWLQGPLFIYNWVDTTQGAFGIYIPAADGTTANSGSVVGLHLNGALTSGTPVTAIPIKATSFAHSVPNGTTITVNGQTTTLTAAYVSSPSAVTTMQVASFTPSATVADNANVTFPATTPAPGPANLIATTPRPIAALLPSLTAKNYTKPQAGFDVVSTMDPALLRGSDALSVQTANNAVYLRCERGGTISKIAALIVTSSGNISVGVFGNTGVGTNAVPGVQYASTGSIACPAAGYQVISLPFPVTMQPGDWLAISADNTVATFRSLLTAPQASPLGNGRLYVQASAHPLPVFPSSLQGYSGLGLALVGIP